VFFSRSSEQSFVSVVKAFLLLYLLAMAFGPSVWADSVTYSYVGNTFDSFHGSFACPPECKITGSFTLDQPLPPNLSLTNVFPTSFSFTDGEFTLTPTNTFHFIVCPIWQFSTDATGAITTWNVCIVGRGALGLPRFGTANRPPYVPEDTTNLFNRDSALILGNPGTWSMATISTPEPSCLLLLCTGLLSIVGRVRFLSRPGKVGTTLE
jgi:hypothetical protein